MKDNRPYLFLGAFLIVVGLALSACQAETTKTSTPELAGATLTPEPAAATSIPESMPTIGTGTSSDPEPTAEPEPDTVMIAPERGLLINEDASRSILSKINTLAYELPGMEEVEGINITYAWHRLRGPLLMDVYYPPDTPAAAQLPVVVFGLGYKMSEVPLRSEHSYTSWGRLVAAAGMVGIVYDTQQPDQDLEILMAFIRENAAALRIDPAQIGFLSVSANPPTVMSYIMQEGRTGIQFAVYYYGVSLTPDRKYADQFSQSVRCEQRGCLYDELADVTYVDPDLPLFIVKAGQDFIPIANEAMDYFVDYVRGEGATVTVVEYENGVHGFDTEQRNEESAAIIAQTIDFMKSNFDFQ